MRTPLSSVALVEDLSWPSEDELPSTGEMGIVSSGTCWEGFGAVATSAMVIVVDVVDVVAVWGCELQAIVWERPSLVGGGLVEVSLKSRRAIIQGKVVAGDSA